MSQIQKIVDTHKELRNDLFIRGFLITNDDTVNRNEFPFYGNWKEEKHDDFLFLTHPLTGKHFYEENGKTFFLMGHAYNPFTMEIDETVILKRIASGYGSDDFFEKINEITGVYVLGVVDNGKCEFLVDPSGMQSACYGVVNDKFYSSSHPQLVGDVCNLQMDDFVKELVAYKWYGRVMGPYLPADLSPFAEVKRIVPGIHYKYDNSISHKRFWPLKSLELAENQADYDKAITEAAEILKNNMELVSRKWSKPWISLTGGIDSNTTFAAANGIYDRFEAFSYISAPKEVPDTEAAKKIADAFDVKHHVFRIPADNSELEKFDAILEVLRHNNGYVAEPPQNEARKRMYLRNNVSCDVEVKSWVSETIRGYWYKHYGRKTMPKLSAKLFRNLYKIFIFNRPLAHKIDNLFARYIKDFEYDKIPACYLPAEMHYNDVTWGSWGGINISEMKYCFDITFIYNNRRFLDLMFRIPLAKRIPDQHHLDMKKVLNKKLYDMNIRVINLKETNFRAFALNCIFTLNSILPF